MAKNIVTRRRFVSKLSAGLALGSTGLANPQGLFSIFEKEPEFKIVNFLPLRSQFFEYVHQCLQPHISHLCQFRHGVGSPVEYLMSSSKHRNSGLKTMVKKLQDGELFAGIFSSTLLKQLGAEYELMASVPGLNSIQMSQLLQSGPLSKMVEHRLQMDNLVALPLFHTGISGLWINHEVHSSTDIQDLKLRLFSAGRLSCPRIAESLKLCPYIKQPEMMVRTELDGVEDISLSFSKELGLHKSAKYLYYGAWPKRQLNFYMFVNRARWQDLPANRRAVFSRAVGQLYKGFSSRMYHQDQQALHRFKSQSELIVKPLNTCLVKELTRRSIRQLSQQVGYQLPLLS